MFARFKTVASGGIVAIIPYKVTLLEEITNGDGVKTTLIVMDNSTSVDVQGSERATRSTLLKAMAGPSPSPLPLSAESDTSETTEE